MGEAIRLGLQTVFGIAMTLFGRYSPRLASAINVGIVLTGPDVWPSVWGIYQQNRNTIPTAAAGNAVNNHDPFAFLEAVAHTSGQWADYQQRLRDIEARERPTQTQVIPRQAPAPGERLPDTLGDSDSGPAVGGDVPVEATEEPKARPAGKPAARTRRADGE